MTQCQRCGGAILEDLEGERACLQCGRDPGVTLVKGTLPDGKSNPRLYGINNGMATGRNCPVVCEICGDIFRVYPSEVGRRKTCGHPCRIEARRRAAEKSAQGKEIR